jgi:LPS-assembly protein
VASFTFGYDPYFTITNRARVGGDFAFNRAESRGRLSLGPARLEGGYVFLAEDSTAGALDDRSEIELAAELDVTRNWTVAAGARRDLEEDAYVDAGVSLRFANECAALELFLSRDFTDSADAPASTDIGLRVRLFGLADGGGARSGVCAANR